MEYKRKISSQDMTEIISWFKDHEKDIPNSIQLDAATKIADVHKYISTLIEIYKLHHDIKAFNGQLYHLWVIKQKIEG